MGLSSEHQEALPLPRFLHFPLPLPIHCFVCKAFFFLLTVSFVRDLLPANEHSSLSPSLLAPTP